MGRPGCPPKDAIVLGLGALEPYHLLFNGGPGRAGKYRSPGPGRSTPIRLIPIAAGERLATIWGWRASDRTRNRRCDPARYRPAGGITQMRKMAALAEAFGHDRPAFGLARTGGRVRGRAPDGGHAQLPRLERVEDDWPGREEVISAPAVLENGHLLVPTRRAWASTSMKPPSPAIQACATSQSLAAAMSRARKTSMSMCRRGCIAPPISALVAEAEDAP